MTEHPHRPPQAPEWRRCGPYFLLAIGLHAALLAYPLRQILTEQQPGEASTILAKLVKPAAPHPVAPPHETSQPSPHPRQIPPSKPTPVLAMEGSPVASSTFAPSPSIPAAPAPTPAGYPAPAAVTAARFDVAYLNNPHPEYPPISRRMGEEGKVLLRVRVNAEGHAMAVDLEKSSNFDRLDEAAKRSVSRWRFVPAKRGDEAIEATVIVPIVFRLDN